MASQGTCGGGVFAGDAHHIFAVDEYYWEDRPRYYAELEAVRRRGGDLSGWLEYCAEGVQRTLEKAWLRLQRLTAEGGGMKVVLRPRQEQLLNLLRDKPGMAPRVRLKRPVPSVRSAITRTETTPNIPAATPSRIWIATSASALAVSV